LPPRDVHPHGLSDPAFEELFTHDGDVVVALAEQEVDEVAADEACSTGHDDVLAPHLHPTMFALRPPGPVICGLNCR